MNFRLTDYWTSSPGIAVLDSQWHDFQAWLQALGFTVLRDHGAAQKGCSCGLVAARVATWLKGANRDFMTHPTPQATSWEVIAEAKSPNVLNACHTSISLPDPI